MVMPASHADKAVAQFFGAVVDHDDGGQNDQRERRQVGIFLKDHGGPELLAQAARADIADDRGRAHIDFETQQRVADDIGEYLRHHAIADLVKPGSPGGLDVFEWSHIDVFIFF